MGWMKQTLVLFLEQIQDNMKTMNLIFAIIITSLFGACDAPLPLPPEPPIVEQDTIFDLIWATRMDFEKEIVNLNNGLLYKEWYLYTGDLDAPPTFWAYNKYTGNLDWELVLNQINGYEITHMFIIENILLARNAYNVFGINLDTKEVIWEENLNDIGFRMGRGIVAENGKYYLVVSENFDPLGGFNQYILEFNPFTGEKREVVKYTPDSIGTKTLSPPVYYQDDIILYNLRPNGELPPEYTKQYMVAYDMNINQELWRTEVTESFASNGLHPPIIYNNTVITGGDWSMYAFDVLTGEQLWRTPIPGYDRFGIFAKTNHLIHNGRLYVNETGPNLTCINPETGDIIWNNTDAANCTDNMVYYQDMLVFASFGEGSVLVIDALTGETLHKEGPYDNSIFNNDVVYDEVRDMFFTSTYKHAIGFKVHKPE